MTPHLLAIEIGPVGEFLSAARKTRDLWFGSGLFAVIARAVAKAVADRIGGHQHLIVPAPKNANDLTIPHFAVADEIWAEVPASVKLEDLDGISGVITSAGFAGMESIDRQNLIGDILASSLTPEERRRVQVIVAVTSDEGTGYLVAKE